MPWIMQTAVTEESICNKKLQLSPAAEQGKNIEDLDWLSKCSDISIFKELEDNE